MPTVLHTAGTVDEIFKPKLAERGLDMKDAPAAVQLAIGILGESAPNLGLLLDDLPADKRVYEWLELIFLSYAEWYARSIVVDSETSPEQGEQTA